MREQRGVSLPAHLPPVAHPMGVRGGTPFRDREGAHTALLSPVDCLSCAIASGSSYQTLMSPLSPPAPRYNFFKPPGWPSSSAHFSPWHCLEC